MINKWNKVKNFRGGPRRATKFLPESNVFHIKSKTIKMLSCKNFAALLVTPLNFKTKKDFKILNLPRKKIMLLFHKG